MVLNMQGKIMHERRHLFNQWQTKGERERERDEDQAFRTLLIDDLLSHHAMHGKNDSEVHKEQNDPVESVPFFQLSHLSTPRTLGNELGNITQSIDASQPFG